MINILHVKAIISIQISKMSTITLEDMFDDCERLNNMLKKPHIMETLKNAIANYFDLEITQVSYDQCILFDNNNIFFRSNNKLINLVKLDNCLMQCIFEVYCLEIQKEHQDSSTEILYLNNKSKELEREIMILKRLLPNNKSEAVIKKKEITLIDFNSTCDIYHNIFDYFIVFDFKEKIIYEPTTNTISFFNNIDATIISEVSVPEIYSTKNADKITGMIPRFAFYIILKSSNDICVSNIFIQYLRQKFITSPECCLIRG